VCDRIDGKRSSNVMVVFAERDRGQYVSRPKRPVHMCDDVKEHGDVVNSTCAAKRCEHVFGKIIDVVCFPVVGVEENFNVFPGSFYGVGMGASPSIIKADSVIYNVMRVALVWKTNLCRPAVRDDILVKSDKIFFTDFRDKEMS
jgi:hypothetical protein